MEITVICPKCGQAMLADCDPKSSAKELDELALQLCSCPEAKIWRQQQMQIAEAEFNIESLCVADARRLGMSEIENDEILEILKKASRLIAYSEVKDITVVTIGHGKNQNQPFRRWRGPRQKNRRPYRGAESKQEILKEDKQWASQKYLRLFS